MSPEVEQFVCSKHVQDVFRVKYIMEHIKSKKLTSSFKYVKSSDGLLSVSVTFHAVTRPLTEHATDVNHRPFSPSEQRHNTSSIAYFILLSSANLLSSEYHNI